MDCRKEFLTTKQVSEYLNIPLRTVYHLTNQGKIKSIRIGSKIRYLKNDIEEYLIFGTDFSREPVRMPNNFIERRAYPRINTNFKCQYSINLPSFKSINSTGIIKDLSAGGVLLAIQNDEINKVKVNDPIDLDFSVINTVSNVKASARVVRKVRNGLGIKFRSIKEEDRKAIIEFVG